MNPYQQFVKHQHPMVYHALVASGTPPGEATKLAMIHIGHMWKNMHHHPHQGFIPPGDAVGGRFRRRRGVMRGGDAYSRAEKFGYIIGRIIKPAYQLYKRYKRH